MLASAGYPASSSSGDVIHGPGRVPGGVEVTHAGTGRGAGGAMVTAGGRVLNVTALGDDPGAARDAAYAAADLITFEGRQLRRDIALRAVERSDDRERSRRRDPDRHPRPSSRSSTSTRPRVGIIMGSKSDMAEMERAGEGPRGERASATRSAVMSAHRDPDIVAEYCKNARMRGLRVIIAGAGLSAALPGVAAAHTDLPVIGVPLSSRMSAVGGLDAMLSIVQMPPGVPVGAVGLDNARNAGHLAARILSI